jgi:hypothetical protein
MTIKNKILFWFLLPTTLVAIATTVFCSCCTYKVVRKNVFDQLEIDADELYKNIIIFLIINLGRMRFLM